jgi:hypothetical protein
MDSCGHCRRAFGGEGQFYSETFARFFSREPMFLLTWCFHCTHISLDSQTWYFRMMRVPMVKRTRTLPITALRDLPHTKSAWPGLEGFVGGHLLRMVWNCLSLRVERELGAEKPEAVVHLAMEKLPPREVALMVMMTVNAPRLVPLEQQIHEGKYLGDSLLTLGSMQNWISSSPNHKAAAAALEMLTRYPDSAKNPFS